MLYNLSSLNTAAQCDTVLTKFSTDRGRLLLRKTDQESKAVSNANSATLIPAQMAQLDAQIASMQVVVDAATDPAVKTSLRITLNNLENEHLRLVQRTYSFEGEELVDRQFAIGKMEFEVNAIDELVTAVETRKAEILSGGGANA